MNIAFIEFEVSGVTRTRAAITPLGRAEFAATLAAGERLESFLYDSPPGAEWPCGPTGPEWRRLLEIVSGDADALRGLEAALAACRHRYLATQ